MNFLQLDSSCIRCDETRIVKTVNDMEQESDLDQKAFTALFKENQYNHSFDTNSLKNRSVSVESKKSRRLSSIRLVKKVASSIPFNLPIHSAVIHQVFYSQEANNQA